MVTLTANDSHGNTATCTATVTVVDNIAPVARCKPAFAVTLGISGTVTINVADIENGSTDNCAVMERKISKDGSTYADSVTFDCTETGARTVTLRVKDASSNQNTCTTTVTVNQRPTTLTYGGATTAYYADCVNVKATLTDNLSGNTPVAGKTVTFTIQGPNPSTTVAASGTAVTDGSGVAMTTITLANTAQPGAYTVKSDFEGMCPYLASGSAPAAFTIVPALAGPLQGQACYTGNLFFWTPGTNSSTATLALSATIRDVTGVCASDIRNAKVTFAIRGSGTAYTPINGAANLPVGLVDTTNKKVGTASAIVQYNIGNASAAQLDICVIVTGAYAFNNINDDRVITVAKPLPGGMIVGGGRVANSSDSSGYLAGDPSSDTCFGFDVEYNKSLTNPQGKVDITVLSYHKPDGTMDTVLHKYTIRSTAIAVLATTPGTGGAASTASFSSKANLNDVTNPANTVSLEGNAALQLDLTDGNQPTGGGDMIGITLQRKAGGVWFAIKWNGVKTVQKAPSSGGEISVK